MKDFDIRECIRESAGKVEVPEALEPDRIEEKLKQADVLFEKSKKSRMRGRRNFYIGYAASAAVLVAVCSFVLFGGVKQGIVFSDSKTEQAAAQSATDKVVSQAAMPGQSEADQDASQSSVVGQAENALSEEKTTAAEQDSEKQESVKQESTKERLILPKEDAGELYKVATDYGQVYDVIDQIEYYYMVVNDAIASSSVRDLEKQMSGATADGAAYMETAEEESVGYSTTNLQTEGVDESDIVKTDGSCLYIVSNNRIFILDITKGKPELLTDFSLPTSNASSDIVEIYVDDDQLLVIAEEKETQLREVYQTTEDNSVDSSSEKQGAAGVNVIGTEKYRTVTSLQTKLYTYSVENPGKPELLGTVGLDGYYYTSRKIDDVVYLFTEDLMSEECRNSTREEEDWVPLAGGERIAADCIYIPESGSCSLIIASVDVDQPEAVVDNVMIVNNNVDIYVSTEAVYLYHTQWRNSTSTEIAKFTLQDGVINAVGGTSVKGSVQDTFAVNESQGMLRILTCSNSTNEGSSLYILDENLALTGKLEGIAPGETVYAARYLGDMAYFVTYRNMDPLFAADLSDPANPVILGELKITGYSDYLHMWTEGKMFGIGYETDPDTGSRQGIKLSMFDISDPVNLSVSDSVCITNADYSPALNQYKTVLADTGANLIGFVVTEYDRTEKNTYLLYQWKNGKLENLLATELGDNAECVRGLYAGDYFYIVTQQSVVAFSRTNGYEKVGDCVF